MVKGLAPILTASRVISAMARVISADWLFLPSCIPSMMPTPMAMTFFIAPPTCTPTTSGDR
jgi:hypothetical protein